MCRMSWKSGSLNFLEPSGPHRVRYGTSLALIHKVGSIDCLVSRALGRFALSQVGVGVSYRRFYKSKNVSHSKANSMATCTFFVLCQLLIFKLSVTIYVSTLYKPIFVSIDDITQSMKKKLLYVTGRCSVRSGQLFDSPRTSTCRTVTHSVQWQVVNWMEI